MVLCSEVKTAYPGDVRTTPGTYRDSHLTDQHGRNSWRKGVATGREDRLDTVKTVFAEVLGSNRFRICQSYRVHRTSVEWAHSPPFSSQVEQQQLSLKPSRAVSPKHDLTVSARFFGDAYKASRDHEYIQARASVKSSTRQVHRMDVIT